LGGTGGGERDGCGGHRFWGLDGRRWVGLCRGAGGWGSDAEEGVLVGVVGDGLGNKKGGYGSDSDGVGKRKW